MTWALAYLLVGFVLYWSAIQSGYQAKKPVRWELAIVLLWPAWLAVFIVLCVKEAKNA